MKKHIKKKFLNEIQIDDEINDLFLKSKYYTPVSEAPKSIKIPKNVTAFLKSDGNKIFRAFSYKYKNAFKLIPEPDPVLIYFHSAYLNFIQIEKRKQEIFEKLSDEKLTENLIKELYDFFGVTSSCVILLFTSIEALVNRIIPITYEYKRVSSKKTEVFSKKQIEEFIPFDEKLNIVLKEITKKSFKEKHPPKYSTILSLKEFRNKIVHTKEAENEATYDYLYKKSFDFDYFKALNATKDLCNFYLGENFIEECPCPQNW